MTYDTFTKAYRQQQNAKLDALELANPAASEDSKLM